MNGENKIMEERMISSFDGTNLRFRKDKGGESQSTDCHCPWLVRTFKPGTITLRKSLTRMATAFTAMTRGGMENQRGKRFILKIFNEMPDDLGQILALAREESGGIKGFSLRTQHGRGRQ